MQVETKFLVWPIRLFYPLELHCDVPERKREINMNANAKEFWPRRNAAAIADAWIQDINAIDESDFHNATFKWGEYVTNNEMTS